MYAKLGWARASRGQLSHRCSAVLEDVCPDTWPLWSSRAWGAQPYTAGHARKMRARRIIVVICGRGRALRLRWRPCSSDHYVYHDTYITFRHFPLDNLEVLMRKNLSDEGNACDTAA